MAFQTFVPRGTRYHLLSGQVATSLHQHRCFTQYNILNILVPKAYKHSPIMKKVGVSKHVIFYGFNWYPECLRKVWFGVAYFYYMLCLIIRRNFVGLHCIPR